MGRKRHTPEQIITALREAEVGLARDILSHEATFVSPGLSPGLAALNLSAKVRRLSFYTPFDPSSLRCRASVRSCWCPRPA